MSRSEFHVRARVVFLGVCELPESERAAFLDSACTDDTELRREVEALLGYHTGSREDGSPSDSGHRNLSSRDPKGPGDRSEGASSPRFETGDVVAERYKIVSLLGSGGMGEVYRALDTSLGTEVALKALRVGRAEWRDSMIQEVRLAREVTHPAVCRVHDLVVDGEELLLSMEYVQGEDLDMLLRRVGRLPPERALEIARQLCSGLAAAHAKGVLHRDLKPGNILIDAAGNVRIADFGIASSTTTGSAPITAGTPGYMAPELLVPGARASEASDIYALGLVLYELATGRRAFESTSSRGGQRRRRAAPERPASLVPDLDPRFSAAILQSIEVDPAQRPESALALAGLLPGSDALQLAAAIGVTPMPQVVAAAPAGPVDKLRPAWLLAALVPLLAATIFAASLASTLEEAEVALGPAVLADRALQMVRDFGYEEPRGDSRYGYMNHPNPRKISESILFWYREPVDLWSPDGTRELLLARPQTPDPPPQQGHIVVLLNQRGKLMHLQADPVMPGEPQTDGASSPELEWEAAILAAGLDPEELEAVEEAPPPLLTDASRAWRGPSGEFTAQAASLGGRLVYFGTDSSPPVDKALAADLEAQGQNAWVASGLAVLLLVTAVGLAVVNLRRGRGDRRGARRLVISMICLLCLSFVLTAAAPDHPLDDQASVILDWLTAVALHGAWLWVGYMAVEPFARRIWPQTLVGWSRLLSGRLRDPAVGRSLLLGLVAGCCMALVGLGEEFLLEQVGTGSAPWSSARILLSSMNARRMMATALAGVPLIVYNALMALVLLVLLRRLVRRPAWAAVGFVLVWGAIFTVAGDSHTWLSFLAQGLPSAAILALLLVRFGLLSFVVAWYTANLIRLYPITLDSGHWYAPATLFVLTLIAVLAALGAWAAARPLEPYRPAR